MTDPLAMMTACHHPHKPRACEHLASIPMTPLDQKFMLVLYSEGEPVPYCGVENERGYHAADNLGKRHIRAGSARTYAIVFDDDSWADQRYALPQLVLAGDRVRRDVLRLPVQEAVPQLQESEVKPVTTKTRTDAIFEAAEALASGEARCVDCGVNPAVLNDTVRVHDSETYATDEGSWVIRCGRCAARC